MDKQEKDQSRGDFIPAGTSSRWNRNPIPSGNSDDNRVGGGAPLTAISDTETVKGSSEKKSSPYRHPHAKDRDANEGRLTATSSNRAQHGSKQNDNENLEQYAATSKPSTRLNVDAPAEAKKTQDGEVQPTDSSKTKTITQLPPSTEITYPARNDGEHSTDDEGGKKSGTVAEVSDAVSILLEVYNNRERMLSEAEQKVLQRAYGPGAGLGKDAQVILAQPKAADTQSAAAEEQPGENVQLKLDNRPDNVVDHKQHAEYQVTTHRPARNEEVEHVNRYQARPQPQIMQQGIEGAPGNAYRGLPQGIPQRAIVMPTQGPHHGGMPSQGGHPQGGHHGGMPLQGGHPQGGHHGGMPPQGPHHGGMPPQGPHHGGMPPQGGHHGGMPLQGGHPQGGHHGGMSLQGGHPQGGHHGGMPPQGPHHGGMPPQGGHPQGGHHGGMSSRTVQYQVITHTGVPRYAIPAPGMPQAMPQGIVPAPYGPGMPHGMHHGMPHGMPHGGPYGLSYIPGPHGQMPMEPYGPQGMAPPPMHPQQWSDMDHPFMPRPSSYFDYDRFEKSASARRREEQLTPTPMGRKDRGSHGQGMQAENNSPEQTEANDEPVDQGQQGEQSTNMGNRSMGDRSIEHHHGGLPPPPPPPVFRGPDPSPGPGPGPQHNHGPLHYNGLNNHPVTHHGPPLGSLIGQQEQSMDTNQHGHGHPVREREREREWERERAGRIRANPEDDVFVGPSTREILEAQGMNAPGHQYQQGVQHFNGMPGNPGNGQYVGPSRPYQPARPYGPPRQVHLNSRGEPIQYDAYRPQQPDSGQFMAHSNQPYSGSYDPNTQQHGGYRQDIPPPPQWNPNNAMVPVTPPQQGPISESGSIIRHEVLGTRSAGSYVSACAEMSDAATASTPAAERRAQATPPDPVEAPTEAAEVAVVRSSSGGARGYVYGLPGSFSDPNMPMARQLEPSTALVQVDLDEVESAEPIEPLEDVDWPRDEASGERSELLEELIGKGRPTLQDILDPKFFPFAPCFMYSARVDTNAVVLVRNIPYETTRAEIIAVLGKNAGLLNDNQEPVHIILDRMSGKTMDVYCELDSEEAALELVEKFKNSFENGSIGRLGTRIIDVELSSNTNLMRALFPCTRNGVEWVDDHPFIIHGSDWPWENFKAFVSGEEIVMLLKNVENAQRFCHSKICPERPYECMISTLRKIPWYMANYITIEQRHAVYEACLQMIILLTDKVTKALDDAESVKSFTNSRDSEHGTNNSKDTDPQRLNRQLLNRLVISAMLCPGFSVVQKNNIAQVAGMAPDRAREFNQPQCPDSWLHQWTVIPKANMPLDILEFYIALIRAETTRVVEKLSLAHRMALRGNVQNQDGYWGFYWAEVDFPTGKVWDDMSLAECYKEENRAICQILTRAVQGGEIPESYAHEGMHQQSQLMGDQNPFNTDNVGTSIIDDSYFGARPIGIIMLDVTVLAPGMLVSSCAWMDVLIKSF
ncbi:hypothetical protein GGR50DRAFT_705123 [Xylaria sp. CBS 124048]|nr:hypothetical protein GGR50DRAFT_705123 [Xylaria sp. CBS 124048]